MNGKLNLMVLYIVTLVAVAAATLFMWSGGLLYAVIILVSLLMEALVLRFTRPEIMKRAVMFDKWWEGTMSIVIAFLAVATAVLSVLDVMVFRVSVFQNLLPLMGSIVMLISAFLIAIQTLRAQPPHGEEKYGEVKAQDRERGPYEVIRHPMMLAVLLGGLSIPLFVGSGIGFIPAALMAMAIVARVAAEDDWRFNNYEWFYDYTKEVSYRLIPMIW